MNNYEMVLLLHPDEDNNIDKFCSEFTDLIKKNQGIMHHCDNWGKKTLAYSINKLPKAIYLCLYIECNPTALTELQYYLKFNQKVIRFLIIKKKTAFVKNENSDNKADKKNSLVDEKINANSIFKKVKFCRLKANKIKEIDYKDTTMLSEYVADNGRITPSRITGTSAKYQRMLTTAIKRARFLSLLPYCDRH